jgi:hypothetical protein
MLNEGLIGGLECSEENLVQKSRASGIIYRPRFFFTRRFRLDIDSMDLPFILPVQPIGGSANLWHRNNHGGHGIPLTILSPARGETEFNASDRNLATRMAHETGNRLQLEGCEIKNNE